MKERVQSILAFEAEIAYSIGLTANGVSAIGAILAFFSGAFYALWRFNETLILAALIFLFFSGFCDALDGALARIYGRTTPFGGFLDSIVDRYADAVVIAGIIVGGLCNLYVGIIALIGSLLVSYARARAGSMHVDMSGVGITERAERILIIVVASIAYFFYDKALWYGMIVLAVLTHVTVLQRALHTYKAKAT